MTPSRAALTPAPGAAGRKAQCQGFQGEFQAELSRKHKSTFPALSEEGKGFPLSAKYIAHCFMPPFLCFGGLKHPHQLLIT